MDLVCASPLSSFVSHTDTYERTQTHTHPRTDTHTFNLFSILSIPITFFPLSYPIPQYLLTHSPSLTHPLTHSLIHSHTHSHLFLSFFSAVDEEGAEAVLQLDDDTFDMAGLTIKYFGIHTHTRSH